VRITHAPSGIVVQCQNERSQLQNRETCMRMLRARLAELKEQERMALMEEVRGEIKKIEWGSQIRSYVFQPYTMVKDHRTNYESGDVDGVMNGELNGFVTAYLQKL
jgi:peptide chain release factor 2